MVVVGETVHIAVPYYNGSWYGVLGYLVFTHNDASFNPIRVLDNAANAWHVHDVLVAASMNRPPSVSGNQLMLR